MPPTSPLLVAAAVLALAPASLFPQTRAGADAVKAVTSVPDQNARVSAPRAQPRLASLTAKLRLKVMNANPAPEGSPERFDVRAKPEWSDDQGFHVDAAGVGYRRRF